MWFFDDDKAGLEKEPSVAFTDKMIDVWLEIKGFENPEEGFRLIFSAGELPKYDVRLNWVREGERGNWYKLDCTVTVFT